MLLGFGIAAALCLLCPAVFSVLKRSEIRARPRLWYHIHVSATALGAVLAILHSGGQVWSPPGLLLGLLLLVAGLGAVIRLGLGTPFAQRFGAQPAAFLGRETPRREVLSEIMLQKTELLRRLDPGAEEALFSPQLGHWLCQPLRSLSYLRLMERERDLYARSQGTGTAFRWSRKAHIALAALLYAGLLVHLAVALSRSGNSV